MSVSSRLLDPCARRFVGLCLLTFAIQGMSRGQYVASVLTNPASNAAALASFAGQEVGATTIPTGHAILWNGVQGGIIDLTVGSHGAAAYATDGGYQAGEFIASVYRTIGSGRGGGGSRTYFIPHAALWHGYAASMKDLNPTGAYESAVLGMAKGQEAGWQGPSYAGSVHATLWAGSAGSAVNIEPVGFANSEAVATDGANQVGFGRLASTGLVHALLWAGTAASVVDLDDPKLADGGSYAVAIDPVLSHEVGYFYPAGAAQPHACQWSGTAASAVDLNPAGLAGSEALSARGGLEAGFGIVGSGAMHAIVWRGTAASATDLHLFLPSGYTWSEALAVGTDGSIVGVAGNFSGRWPVVWRPQSRPYLTILQAPLPGPSGWTAQATNLSVQSPLGSKSTITVRLNGVSTTTNGPAASVAVTNSGSYNYQVSATDGTTTTPTQMYTVNVDLVAPTTTASFSNPILTLVASDANSGVASTSYILDGGSTLLYNGPVVLQNISHTVQYWSQDRAGNVEAHHSLTIAAEPPALTSLTPTSTLTGGVGFTLVLKGSGFIPASYARWNGVALTTTFVNSTTLDAAVPASDLSSAGSVTIDVTNPSPGTGTTKPLSFAVLARATASGLTTNQGDLGPLDFDISPVTTYAGFTLSGNTVHVVTNTSTQYLDAYGNPVDANTFIDSIGNGQKATVVGSYDPATSILTAWTARLG